MTGFEWTQGFVTADFSGLALIAFGSLVVIFFSIRFRRRYSARQKQKAQKLPQPNSQRPWL